MKTCSHKNVFTNVKAALFIVAEKWKQPKCPLTGERTSKM